MILSSRAHPRSLLVRAALVVGSLASASSARAVTIGLSLDGNDIILISVAPVPEPEVASAFAGVAAI